MSELRLLLRTYSDSVLTAPAVGHCSALFPKPPVGSTFGNARFPRNALEAAIGAHAWRLRDVKAPTKEQLRQLLPQDLDEDKADAEAPTKEQLRQLLPQDLDEDKQGDPA